MPNLMIFRPDYEILTHYVSRYLEAYVVGYASQLGFTVTDLHGANATQSNFFQKISPQEVVVFGTHGLEDRLFAQYGDVLLSSCVNDQALSGKLCFALACKSATKLGYSAVDKRCSCYFGWLQDFIVIIDETYEDPLEDPYAGSFLRPVINGINTMLLDYLYRKSLRELANDVYTAVIDSYNAEIQHWRRIDSPTASQMLTYLYWDRDNFIPIFREEIYVPTPTYIGIGLKDMLAIGLLALPLFVAEKASF